MPQRTIDHVCVEGWCYGGVHVSVLFASTYGYTHEEITQGIRLTLATHYGALVESVQPSGDDVPPYALSEDISVKAFHVFWCSLGDAIRTWNDYEHGDA